MVRANGCWLRHGRRAAWFAVLWSSLCGCASQEATNKPRLVGVARSTTERGPVRVSVEVAPEPARLSDEPTLTLTIDYEHGVRIEKPPFGEALGNFLIRDFREPLPEVRDNREIVRQIYTLEPTATGTQQIDPIPVTFFDERPQGDGQRHELETEALTVHVLSLVTSDAPSLHQIEGFAAPVPLPASSNWLLWLAAAAPLLIGVGAALWLLQRRQPQVVTVPLSPRERAEQELASVWETYQAARDIKLFYIQLTAVVRQYIEDTTGIRAPERTTEEFLREIATWETLVGGDRERLQEFLESADLVKFAAHRPDAADIEEAFRRARRFVGLDWVEIPP